MNSQPHPHAPDEAEEQVADVTRLHVPVMREHSEPRDGLEPIPPWFAAMFGALFFFGGYYLALNNGDFRADILDNWHTGTQRQIVQGSVRPAKLDDLPLPVLGKRIYSRCVACHQSHGNGVPNQYPPLAGSEWVLQKPKSVLIRILLNGMQGPVTVKGSIYNNQMPAWGIGAQALSDKQIAGVLTYIRSEWGNSAPEITEADVAATRKVVIEEQKRRLPWTEAELLAITEDDPPLTPPAAAPPAPAATPPPS
jgi:mono/diheme cytochrome c family protein